MCGGGGSAPAPAPIPPPVVAPSLLLGDESMGDQTSNRKVGRGRNQLLSASLNKSRKARVRSSIATAARGKTRRHVNDEILRSEKNRAKYENAASDVNQRRLRSED